jgi:hypothetical protein
MPHDEAAKAHHIQIVVLDALVRRKAFVDQAGTNSHDFVRRDGRTDPAATDTHPPIHVSRGNGVGQRHNEIRIIGLLVKKRLPLSLAHKVREQLAGVMGSTPHARCSPPAIPSLTVNTGKEVDGTIEVPTWDAVFPMREK